MSMFADYLQEKTNTHIVETDKGWATYEYIEPNTVYIKDLYVVPEFRKSGVAAAMADSIVEKAKSKGCKALIGSVKPSAKDSTASMLVLVGYGMKLVSSSEDFIVFRKDI